MYEELHFDFILQLQMPEIDDISNWLKLVLKNFWKTDSPLLQMMPL